MSALFGESHPSTSGLFGAPSDPVASSVAAVPGNLFAGGEATSSATPSTGVSAPPAESIGRVSALFGGSELAAQERLAQPGPQERFGDGVPSTGPTSGAPAKASSLFGDETT